MKQAIHFGGGNIGRGFIGELLVRSGYEVTFIDVAEALVDEINKRRSYDIEVVGNDPKIIHVEHVKAINSNTNLEDLLDAFVTADIVTTAIGPNILKFIASNIAKGLARRLETNDAPLNIIACENMVGGSTVLRNFVYEHLAEKRNAVSASRTLPLTASFRFSTTRILCSSRSSRLPSGMLTARVWSVQSLRSRA